MENRIRPYIISADFDEKTEVVDSKRWIAGAAVELGDANEPRFVDDRSYLTKKIDRILFGKGHEGDPRSLGCIFTFFVCSSDFKNNPTDAYKKYADIMLTQEQYNAHEAKKWLTERVEHIGDVTETELTRQLHTFLESEEWDFALNPEA